MEGRAHGVMGTARYSKLAGLIRQQQRRQHCLQHQRATAGRADAEPIVAAFDFPRRKIQLRRIDLCAFGLRPANSAAAFTAVKCWRISPGVLRLARMLRICTGIPYTSTRSTRSAKSARRLAFRALDFDGHGFVSFLS